MSENFSALFGPLILVIFLAGFLALLAMTMRICISDA
jgi:hypothetical protein